MDRLQPVAGVGQRALGDGRQRVGEVALAQRILQRFGRMSSLTGFMPLQLYRDSPTSCAAEHRDVTSPPACLFLAGESRAPKESAGQRQTGAMSAASTSAFCEASRKAGSANSRPA